MRLRTVPLCAICNLGQGCSSQGRDFLLWRTVESDSCHHHAGRSIEKRARNGCLARQASKENLPPEATNISADLGDSGLKGHADFPEWRFSGGPMVGESSYDT